MKTKRKAALSLAFMVGVIICASFGVLPLLAYMIVIFACVAMTL